MPTLRVTGGTLRGRRISLPPHDLRPTSERARQAYFNIVASKIESAAFLDLFAGSGIFSFEAVSRGAVRALAVDKSSRAVDQIQQRAKAWDLPIRGLVSDVLSASKRLGPGAFDLVYADPPYDYARYEDLLKALDEELPLCPGAVVAVEHRRGAAPDASKRRSRLEFRRTVEYGSVAITLYDVPTGDVESAGE